MRSSINADEHLWASVKSGRGRSYTFLKDINNITLVEELKTNFMSLVVFISLIFAQHVSNINMSIFRSLRL